MLRFHVDFDKMSLPISCLTGVKTLHNMIDNNLTIDPTVRIFHARGTFFAAWQPMHKAPIEIRETDFVLFSVINNASHKSELVRLFRARLRSLFLPDCSRLHSKSRINDLVQAGILLTAQNAAEAIPGTPAPVEMSKFNKGATLKKPLPWIARS